MINFYFSELLMLISDDQRPSQRLQFVTSTEQNAKVNLNKMT